MKRALLFLSMFSLFVVSTCTVSPADGTDPGDSTEVDPPVVDSVIVTISEASYTSNSLRPGLYVKWIKITQAMEYRVYFQTGDDVDKFSDYETVDAEESEHIIDYADLDDSENYTIAVTAVSNAFETSLDNKVTVTKE